MRPTLGIHTGESRAVDQAEGPSSSRVVPQLRGAKDRHCESRVARDEAIFCMARP